MISAWTLYWILTLDSLNGVCVLLAVVAFIGMGITFVIGLAESDSRDPANFKCAVKYFKVCLSVFCIILLIGVFVPSTNQMAMIYIIPKLSNSEFMKTVPDKLEKLANKELDSLLGSNNK